MDGRRGNHRGLIRLFLARQFPAKLVDLLLLLQQHFLSCSISELCEAGAAVVFVSPLSVPGLLSEADSGSIRPRKQASSDAATR